MSAEQVGDIVIRLSSDQARFDADIKQARERLRNFSQQAKDSQTEVKGLGQRMGEAADYSKLLAMNLQESFGVLTGAAAGVVGLATGLAMYVSSAAEHGRELQEYAIKAGLTVEQVQALSYATEQYNISGDKMADILKDTREKLGEYAASGGGGFKDFFENVAPKVGLTVQQLQKLSGPDALIAVKKAMDDANVSAQEQTWYLESIASDLSVVNPLLENNGARLRELTSHYESLNAALSATDIQNLTEMDQKFKDISLTLQGAFAQGVVGASSQIDWFTDKLSYAVRYWGTLLDSMNDNPRTEDGLSKRLGEARENLGDLQQQLADIQGKYKPGEEMLRWDKGAVDELNAQIKEQQGVIDGLQTSYEKLRFGMHGGMQFDQPVPQIVVPPSSGPGPSSSKPKTSKKETAPTENYSAVDSFRAETAAISAEMAKRQALLKNSQDAMLESEQSYQDQRAADLQIAYGASVIEEQNRYAQAQQRLQQQYASAYDAAAGNHDLEFSLQQERYTALEQMDQDHQTRLLQIEQDRIGKQRAYQQQVSQELLSYTQQTMSITTDALQQAGMEHTGVYKALFLMQKAAAIPSMIVATEEAATKAMAAFPPPYSLGLATAVRTMGYTSIGMVAGQALAGMAHDGIDNIPKEGTWFLDKGERVVDSRTNADLKSFLSGSSGNAGGGTIIQHFHFEGVGGDSITQQLAAAARDGAQQGYEMMLQDFATRGTGRRMLNV
jgi:hypothetical protein